VVGIERVGGVEQQLAPLVGVCACVGAGLREEVSEELDLEVLKSGVVEDLLHLAQGALLELVLDVRVPQAQSPEADPRRIRAAIAPVEQAPLAAHMDLGGAGHRPVQGQ